jgi:capsular exopolysaccharide synthesis family protein
MESSEGKPDAVQSPALQPFELIKNAMAEPTEMEATPTVKIDVAIDARLVSLTDARGLGAEKFRALVTRLEHQRKDRQLRSLQVTSAINNEGKTLVAGNLAVTLAKHTGSRVLLVEGDLHRPTLASLFGLRDLRGIGDWWKAREENERIAQYVYRLNEIPLYFLGAGRPSDQPSQVLQSSRFGETFARLTGWFDWVVVDSAPILPVIDANLWSRIVDGTLLVVREGVTPLKALKKSMESLDRPELIGIVLNEASELSRTNYADQYYALGRS